MASSIANGTIVGSVYLQLMSIYGIFRSASYLNAPPLSGLLEMSNPAYTDRSSTAMIISIGKCGNEVAEQIVGKMTETCVHFNIPAALVPIAMIPFGNYGIGVVIIDFEDANSADLTRLLHHECAALTPRPLLMTIILPPSTSDPVIHYDPAAFNGWIDCIWQPEPQQVSMILPAVNHWLNLYLHGGLTGFDYNDYHRLFGVPPFSPCLPLQVMMAHSMWIENDEEVVTQWVNALATQLSAATLDRVQAMLVILAVSEKSIHRLAISHYDDLINECRDFWETEDRKVYLALSPSPFPDNTWEGDVRLTLFLR